jgi:hypothetical protein
MRTLFIAALFFVAAASSTARAADHAPPPVPRHAHPKADAPLPRFRLYTPYDQVRASLIRPGYRPIHILKWPDYAGVYCRSESEARRLYPERFVCSMTDCIFLLARPSDGALIEIVTDGDAPGNFEFHFARRADANSARSLRTDYVIARPASKDRRQGPSGAQPRPAPDR